MVAPVVVAAGIKAVGNVIGGKKADKAAKRAIADNQTDRNDAVVMTRQDQDRLNAMTAADQARAIGYRKDDEARMKAATGYDLVKLRDDAVKAGFNPLTVLQSTGGAGYDGRGAVMTTPFVASEFLSTADPFIAMSGAVAAARGVRVDTAGYLGKAIAGLGDDLIGMEMQKSAQAHERAMQQADFDFQRARDATIRLPGSARVMTDSPVQGYGAANPDLMGPFVRPRNISVFDPNDRLISVDASWAERNGFKPGDKFEPGDLENWLGEAGQAASVGYAAERYPALGPSIWKGQVGRGPVLWDGLGSDAAGWLGDKVRSIAGAVTGPFVGGGGFSDKGNNRGQPLRLTIGGP